MKAPTRRISISAMKFWRSLWRVAGFAALLATTSALAVSPNIVISQVYGGGGNTGAIYKNDFIELFNRGTTSVSVAGWSVQYAAATGTSWTATNLTGSIPAGGYYLVQQAAGANTLATALPTPNATGNIAMAGAAGKVALVNTTTALTGACPTGATIVDFVGFGTTANCFEGTAATPAPSNTLSVVRAQNGCTDTDANSSNFSTITSNTSNPPRNSATTINVCPNLSVSSVTQNEGNAGTTTFTFTVTLSAAQAGATTFDITTVDGTATAGSDYVAKTLTGQSIAAGMTSYTFTVNVNGDTLAEGDETFTVVLSNASPASINIGPSGTGTITNDDAVSPNLTINNVTLNEGNAGTTSFNFTVSLSAPAGAGGVTFDIATANGTAVAPADYTAKTLTAQTIPVGQNSYSFTVLVNGDTVGEPNETFSVNITNVVGAIGVTTTGTGTITNDDVFRIHDVQGSGTASPLAGQVVTVEGVVTADFQGANQLKGFYIQEPDALIDADPATSEGVFIFTNAVPYTVAVGDLVRVVGSVTEFGTAPNTLTEIITPTITTLSVGNPLPALTIVNLPIATAGELERYEGMRVQFSQTLTVSDHFDLAHFGEITLSANGRSFNPTNVVDPNDNPASGTAGVTNNTANVTAFADLNTRSRILLDDASTVTYPAIIPFADPATGSLRLGSTVANLTGILSQSFGSHRLYATATPAFNYAARPLTPPAVGGNLKVGAMNVLNYFNGDGLGGGFPTSRGADTLAEFTRQRAKVIAALLGLNADIVTLMEIENDGVGVNSAVQDLVNGLNATAGAGVWAFVGDPAGWGTFNGSTDAIKATIIYKTTKVTPVGLPTSPSDPAFVNARAPVAQKFQMLANGEQLIVIANHFKSKGSGGTGLDADLGQGFFNNARTLQAGVLLNFISTFTGSPRVIALGDFNAYEQEDPIDRLRAGGMNTLINNTYSYMFAGLSGSLDHALGNAPLSTHLVAADKWHINADEPVYLDYNVETKNTAGCASQCTTPDLYSAIPFRASDHDPVLVGLQINGPQCLAGSYSVDGFANCTLASSGNFVATVGATSQTPCAAGSFSGATGAIACTPSSPGSFVSTAGAAAPTPCVAGSYSSTSGATGCTSAGLGFFVPTVGAPNQTACPVNTTTNVTGASMCVPITFTVTASAGLNGSITPLGAQTANINSAIAFTVTANANFAASVATDTGQCGGNLAGNTFTTAAIVANCTVVAVFTPIKCVAGSFSATGNAPCTLATAGNFVAIIAATSQTPASPGSFVSGNGAITQTACGVGTFSAAAGAISCTPAAIGFFVPTTGAATQTACAIGTTTATTGASTCVPITYTVTPSADANGTVSPNTAQTVNHGSTATFTVTANVNFNAAVATGVGNCGGTLAGNTYTTAAVTANCNVAAIFSPTQCIAGSFSASGNAPCTLASAGNFVAIVGATAQTPASPGSFVAGIGALVQTQCAAGSFSPLPGASACTQATAGSFVAVNGATSQTPASPGSFVASASATAQTLCTAGSFSPLAGATACTQSTAGSFVAVNGATAQTPASPGSFVASASASAQTLCAAGSFSPLAGATACTQSTAGNFVPTTGAIAPTPASAGSFVSGIGASAQTPCAAGSFSSAAGATSCTLAALGFFTPTTGATAQTACAPGTTTLAVGATVCVPITFTVTPSVNAVGVITPSTPQLVVVGSTTSFTVFPLTANANFIASVATGPGNCGGTLDGATFTTLPITANCAVAVTFSAPQGQTINFVPLANVTLPSPPVVLSAVASSGLVVSFASNTLAVCTVTGNSVTLLTTGLCSITASQAGSRTFLPAAEFTRSFTAFVRAALQPPEVSTRAGEILSFNFTPGDANATGTARFSFADGSPVPGCESVPLVGGMASCVVPSRFSFISPLTITASYAGDASNPPLTSSFVQVSQADQAVVTTSTEPASPVQAGSPVTITALVRMRNVAGTVSFTPNLSITGTPAPSANCTNLPLTLMPNSTDAAIATCQMIPPTAGTAQVVAVYRYPAGHVSNRIFEQTVQTISVVNNAPIDYTDLWWGGARENGWGVSITQHGNTQVSVIYNYDSAGKPIWYFQSGCVLVGNTCTGAIFQPAGTPLTAYDTAKFSIGAPIGSATFTFRNANTATLSYTINGVSGTKEIERLTFAPPSTLPRLPVADLWWRGLVENGWGLSITQQGRQLFPVIYTYDSAGKTTFYVVPGGTWSGLTFTGDLYSTTSSPWLGVPYDASKFQATKVGTLVIDYRDAGTATITYTINGVSQTRVISRQGF